jgi:hypothetical protein
MKSNERNLLSTFLIYGGDEVRRYEMITGSFFVDEDERFDAKIYEVNPETNEREKRLMRLDKIMGLAFFLRLKASVEVNPEGTPYYHLI